MPELLGKQIGPTGFGMMRLPVLTGPDPTEEAIKLLRTALDAGCNFWNGGEFYGTPELNTQTIVAAYFRKYPEDADKVVLSVKGAFDHSTMTPTCSPKDIKRSMDKILKDLGGTKKIDIFECARIDPTVSLEVSLKYLEDEYVKKGIIGGIAISEVSSDTVRRAAKITKITSVEVELSLWSTHIMDNGVAAACAELNIPIVAYSPIGQGMLGGQIKSLNDLPEKDMRRLYPRFQPENFHLNLELVAKVEELAKSKGCTPAQLAINWTKHLSKKPGMPVIIPIPGASSKARVLENAREVELSAADMSAIDNILASVPVQGTRYPDFVPIDG